MLDKLIIYIAIVAINCYKRLGVTLDEILNWEHHIDMIVTKVNAGIAVIKRMKTYVSQEFLQRIYNPPPPPPPITALF